VAYTAGASFLREPAFFLSRIADHTGSACVHHAPLDLQVLRCSTKGLRLFRSILRVRGTFSDSAWLFALPEIPVTDIPRGVGSLLNHSLGRQFLGAQMARVAQFEPTAWWYTREQIGPGLREHYGQGNDLPPHLLLLVRKLDRSGDETRSTWLADLCLLALVAAIVAASFRFHFVF
jgi:hypothetical protein